MNGANAKVLVFVNTKKTADFLNNYLYRNYDYPTASLHGDHSQNQRDDVMQGMQCICRIPFCFVNMFVRVNL